MFNDTPAWKTDRLLGQTNGKLKPNSHITKYVTIHKVIIIYLYYKKKK